MLAVAAASAGAFFVWQGAIDEPIAKRACPETRHYSSFSTADLFDDAYRQARPQKSDPDVRGILVPHHLLAARFIAEAFETIATKREVTVVVVSPNHFSAGNAAILSTPSVWMTPYGQLESNCEAVESLRQSGAFSIDEAPFEKEHGISGIVPFIKHSLPNARIVPIILKDSATDAELDRAFAALRNMFGPRALMVASFDFSHEMTPTVADFHDRKSLAVLENLDEERAKALDIDSVPGLRLSMRLMQTASAEHFSLLAHSNSAALTERPDQSDVTSYLAGAFSPGKKAKNDDITLLAFGDMMLARTVETFWRRRGPAYPFEAMPRLFKGSDFTTANAEGVFVDVPESRKPVRPDDLRFPFATSLLSVLKRVGFTHLGAANNHSLNFGRQALDDSRASVRQAGIELFGDPGNQGEISNSAEVHGKKVVQIGYHQFDAHGPEDVLESIAAAKKNGAFVIVYPHWGVEYARMPAPSQVTLGHQFIDAGADVVLGAHPHVIEPLEIYKGKAIFYSMGNFIFDQSFSRETSQGLAVGIAENDRETTFYLIPLLIKDAQASLMPYAERVTILQSLAVDSLAPDEIKQAISAGTFSLKKSSL